MDWYYAKHGRQEGPVPFETLQGMYRSGQIAPTDLVWKEGMPKWAPAGEVAELNPKPTSPPPPPQAQAPSLDPPGVSPPTAAPPTIAPPSGGYPPVAHRPIPNYLVPAILVTIFCCLPFGIPAVVYASKVDGLLSTGDIAGAEEASKKAKLWVWISFGIWFPTFGFFFLLSILSSM